MTGRRVWRSTAIATAAVCWLTAGVVPASAVPGGRTVHLSTVSSAQPTDQAPSVVSTQARRLHSAARVVTADAAATASSTCDGCTGEAVTLQIVYLRHARDMTVENLASATSSCVGCASSALSVQVVIGRTPQVLVANNRSMAVNTSCTGCTTTAAAYQFVLVSDSQRDLSHQGRAMVAQIRDEMAQLLSERQPPTQIRATQETQEDRTHRLRAALESSGERMQAVLAGDLDARPAKRQLDLRTG
jgi:hypothetical protein